MDANERQMAIFKAAYAVLNAEGTMGDSYEAAVRAAYEIDGVGELVEAAEMFSAKFIGLNEFLDGEARLLAAAARVREAMGGNT